MNEIVVALEPVVDVLERLGVRYRVGGSVASSALGVPRSTLDVDISCELRAEQAAAFAAALVSTYYVDPDMIREAARRRASFNLIHLSTMLKVDVFIRKETPFERESFERFVTVPLEEGGRTFAVTTPEDIILHKLDWYQLGGAISERQWHDVLGVIRVQRTALDLVYLRRAASMLGVVELLERALAEAVDP
jgi:hypothetical protein